MKADLVKGWVKVRLKGGLTREWLGKKWGCNVNHSEKFSCKGEQRNGAVTRRGYGNEVKGEKFSVLKMGIIMARQNWCGGVRDNAGAERGNGI